MIEVKRNKHLKEWYLSLPKEKRKIFKAEVFEKIFLDEKTSEKKRYRWDNTFSGRTAIEAIVRQKFFEIASKIDCDLVINHLFKDYYEINNIEDTN